MLIRTLFLTAVANTAYAVKDAGPLIFLSTESLPSPSPIENAIVSTSSRVQAGLESIVNSCDASLYIFVQQPGVEAADLQDATSMPKLAQRIESRQYKSSVSIPTVVEYVDVEPLKSAVEEKCGAGKTDIISFAGLQEWNSASERAEILRENDLILEQFLATLVSNHTSHTIIYTSTRASSFQEEDVSSYEMDPPPFEDMHTDLKRDLDHGIRKRQQSKNDDDFQNGLPLFEKYQFFSPAIFMGLSVTLLLFLILYVGVSAIAGLEVSYMAFSKEMGPQAQKKQQ